jgi:hypothetical protein
MVSRRGSATTGCLTWLLGFVVLLYVGVHVGEPYYRYYRFRDEVNQQARFGTFRPDSVIRKDIIAAADSFDLPEAASRLRILRDSKSIRISGSYVDQWTLLSYTRPVLFTIVAEGRL